jgi:hypothetical protein
MQPAERLAGPRPGGPVQLRSGLRAIVGYTRTGRAHGVVTTRSPRGGWRCGTLTDGPMAASWWQGVPQEHQWGPEVAPGKAAGGGAHPNGGAA